MLHTIYAFVMTLAERAREQRYFAYNAEGISIASLPDSKIVTFDKINCYYFQYSVHCQMNTVVAT